MAKNPKIFKQPIGERIAKARQEKRTQHALELTRTLAKYEPTDAHRELLRQVTLERAQDLQGQGKTGDAVTIFNHALTMGGTPEFLAKVALGLTACGAVAQAMTAVEKLPDPAVRQQVLNQTVDAAVARGLAGKNVLPEPLHGPFDLILQAFAHYEAGRDEEARTALQGIGLQSPFLEWKVLLRGLIAYQASDDARALENWQRLDQNRLPSRLCAPLRAGIDPAFLRAQPEAVQQSLRTKLMQHQGLTSASVLRELRDLLQKENLAPAFRKAESLVPNLRRENPAAAARLANVFFWAIVGQGQPEDLDRYLRVFGAPPDDPRVKRLEALALEARGLWPEAHKAWQNFIDQVAGLPQHWPGETGKRVQAIIWARMAENAMPERKRKGSSDNPLFDLFANQTGPLKPSAEQCYENAIKLYPDGIGCYHALFELYRDDDKLPKAKKIGQELLKRFPDQAETLEALGELSMDTKEYKKAQEYFEKAMHANPLKRELRILLIRAKRLWALDLTLHGKFDDARARFEEILKLWDAPKTPLLCQWAVCEMKAKNLGRAQELIAQALAEPGFRLTCRFALVAESVRAKLPPKEKKQIAQELKDAFAQAPTPDEIVRLVANAAGQRMIHDEAYHGQKTQEKTVLSFLEGVHFDAFDEMQLQTIAGALKILNARKPWLNCLNHARRRHLKNPLFRLSFADYYLMDQSRDNKSHLAREHLDAARRLIEEMPRGEQQQQLLDALKDKEEFLGQMGARQGAMLDVLDRLFGGYGPEEEEDFEDEGDEW